MQKILDTNLFNPTPHGFSAGLTGIGESCTRGTCRPDSSFMQIIAKTSVPSCDLDQTYEQLKKLFTKLENRMKSK